MTCKNCGKSLFEHVDVSTDVFGLINYPYCPRQSFLRLLFKPKHFEEVMK